MVAGLAVTMISVQGAPWGMDESCFSGEFSSGYVFKTGDCNFEKVYGKGMLNAITFDGCYTPCRFVGIGAKVSYWRAHGCTTFLKLPTCLWEVPLTAYLRGQFDTTCGVRLYASLGGGAAIMKEKSYLGNVCVTKGIGEIEVGLIYPLWRHLNITAAFRYLFPPQSRCGTCIDVGGCDLRAGLGFFF